MSALYLLGDIDGKRDVAGFYVFSKKKPFTQKSKKGGRFNKGGIRDVDIHGDTGHAKS